MSRFFRLQMDSSASRSSSKATDANIRSRRLETRIDRLTMICNAMWLLLKEHTDLTEEDLFQKVEDVDLRDGVLDGKVAKETTTCVNCGRVMSARHSQCLYCGNPRPVESAFDEVL